VSGAPPGRHPARRRLGFSLVELLVAALLLGLLLAGMARVFLACLDGWGRVNRALAAQRALRWAVARISEDVQLMGLRLPPPELRPPEPPGPGAVLLLPDRPIGSGAAGSADELSFLLDAPIPVPAVLAGAVAGAGSEAAVPVRCAAKVELAAGDLLLVLDGRFEWAEVRQPVRLAAGAAAPMVVSGLRRPHPAGTRLQLVRPLRVVRYALVQPAPEAGLEAPRPGQGGPSLVRFEAPWRGSMPRWAGLLGRQPGPGGGSEVVAEQVAGFRVDLSLDGRFPGIRGAGPRAPAGNLQALRTLDPGPADPLWFRRHPAWLRLTLEVREADARGRGHALTWDLAPRNFGLAAARPADLPLEQPGGRSEAPESAPAGGDR